MGTVSGFDSPEAKAQYLAVVDHQVSVLRIHEAMAQSQDRFLQAVAYLMEETKVEEHVVSIMLRHCLLRTFSFSEGTQMALAQIREFAQLRAEATEEDEERQYQAAVDEAYEESMEIVRERGWDEWSKKELEAMAEKMEDSLRWVAFELEEWRPERFDDLVPRPRRHAPHPLEETRGYPTCKTFRRGRVTIQVSF